MIKSLADSTSSLRNGYVGSFTTLAQPIAPENEENKYDRAVSLAETSPGNRQLKEQESTEKKESTLISPSEELGNGKEKTGKVERCLSFASSEGGFGCGGARKKKGYKKFGEAKSKEEDNKKLTARQWLLLVVLSLATLTSSFAICLFPPFYPRVVSKNKSSFNCLYFQFYLFLKLFSG